MDLSAEPVAFQQNEALAKAFSCWVAVVHVMCGHDRMSKDHLVLLEIN